MANDFNFPTETLPLGNELQSTINARHLHERLGVSWKFADWIKDRIARYGFAEDEDFTTASGRSEGFFSGRPRIEYFLSLEMAKELALVENNEQGRAIRKALIRMEKRMQEEIPALIANLQKELLAARPDWQKISRYEAMGLTHNEIARLSGITSTTVRDKLKRMSRCKLVQYKPDPRLAAQGRKGMQALQQRLALEGGES